MKIQMQIQIQIQIQSCSRHPAGIAPSKVSNRHLKPVVVRQA